MSQLRVATWNAEGMFVEKTETRRATPHDALATLRQIDADIVVVPGFGRLSDLKEEVRTTIRALGYELVTLMYDEPRTPGLGFAIMSRLPVTRTEVHVLKGSKREVLEVMCRTEGAEDLHVLGVHLDDRSEAGRLIEIAGVTEIVDRYPADRVLLLGDFNAMHRDSWFARLARSRVAHGISRYANHELIRSMADRAHEMAFGTTIEYVHEHMKLHDLDPSRKSTISAKQAGLEWVPAWRLAKVDWMFGSKHFTTISYRILSDSGSDHRPVVAVLDAKL